MTDDNSDNNRNRQCKYCQTQIGDAAKVCYRCGRNQCGFINSFSNISVLVSIGLLILSVMQLNEARKKSQDVETSLRAANNALLRAGEAEQKVGKMLDQMQKLAVTLTDPVASTLAVPGPMQYIHLKYKIEQINHISSVLREMGVPQKSIDEAVSIFVSRVRGDHMRHILGLINMKLPADKKLFKDVYEIDLSSWDMSRIRKVMTENGIESKGDLAEAILDLEFYEKNRKLRRENIWQG